MNISISYIVSQRSLGNPPPNNIPKHAGSELGQTQLKLELKLGFILFKICCIDLINIKKNGTELGNKPALHFTQSYQQEN